ncbi:MAG: peptidoglycan-associated lipoprotein Pal [Acidobacteria bacterium]|nr:peptidoglycan-associated lipoprotein Pal [Acidobacteriota bacterium]
MSLRIRNRPIRAGWLVRRDRRHGLLSLAVVAVAASLAMAGCGQRQAPVPAAPPAATAPPVASPLSRSTVPPDESVPALSEVLSGPIVDDDILSRSLDELNRDSPLSPVFFGVDSAELDDAGRAVVASNAATLSMYPTWTVTIEGSCDERGTAEYNLALGERRAVAVKAYLVSLGIAASRVQTVSYGKEYPFDAGHDERAWAQNRRGHFVITGK